MNLCELGVNPEALAACVKEIRKEANSVSGTITSQPNNDVQNRFL
jgi:hypothetical protein